MPFSLSEEEIRRRILDWYNWKKEIPKLREENRQLRQRVKELEMEFIHERKERAETVEALRLQIEELRVMVFGKGKNDDDEPPAHRNTKPLPGGKIRQPRDADSYRRPVPPNEEVTKENHYGIDTCPDCGEPLMRLREAARYIEVCFPRSVARPWRDS